MHSLSAYISSPITPPLEKPTQTLQNNENTKGAYNLDDGSLTRIATAPPEGKFSGVYANRLGGRAYITGLGLG